MPSQRSPGDECQQAVMRIPEAVVGRDEERQTVQSIVRQPTPQPLHIVGPHGSGKTLLTALAAQELAAEIWYIPCRRYDSQYQVLARLTTLLTGESVSDGYHTAQLQRRTAAALQELESGVLVLDDIEFLLQNDGDDLLYFLSRLEHSTAPTLITTSTPGLELATVLDTRTYSSCQPQSLAVAPYTTHQAARILATHAADMVDQPITAPVTTWIARQTTNIRLGLDWLARAAEVHDTTAVLTADALPPVRCDAVRRYWRSALADFTRQHPLVLKAVEQATETADHAYTGAVYDQYLTLCRYRDRRPLTLRRISDFLDHLELLGLIQVDHFRGGATGKTRAVRLTRLEEL